MLRVAFAALAGAVLSEPSLAQDAEEARKVTVMSRSKPELDPVGARLGSFLLFPTFAIREEYTDNVFKTDDDTSDDFVLHFAPGGRLESDWNNHAVELGVATDIAMYADHDSEDYEDVSVWANGRADIARSTKLFGGILLEDLHEDRGSPDDVAGRRPTTLDRLTASVGVSQRLNRLTVEGEARLIELDFNDVRAAAGGEINNDDRDRDVYLGAVKLGYDIVPNYLAFVRGTVNERDYRARIDDLGFNRDSHGYDISAGTEFDLTGITYGEVHVGYREQIYDDSRFGSLDGISFGARLTSNLTPLTTLQLFVDREIEETSVTTAEGYWSTSVRVTADHELLRNLVISARLSFGVAEYEGISRDDEVYDAGLSATYQVNRHLGITGGYRYEARDSSGAARDEDYVENLFLLRLTGRL